MSTRTGYLALREEIMLVIGRGHGIIRAIAAGRHLDGLAAADHGMGVDTEQADVTDEASIAVLAGRITAPDHVVATASAPVAISPGTGPLPAIYVPPPGEAGSTGVLWRATARSARRAVGWATRHLRSPRRPAFTRMASTHESSPQATKGVCDGR